MRPVGVPLYLCRDPDLDGELYGRHGDSVPWSYRLGKEGRTLNMPRASQCRTMQYCGGSRCI